MSAAPHPTDTEFFLQALACAEARHANIKWLGAAVIGAHTPAIPLDDALAAWKDDIRALASIPFLKTTLLGSASNALIITDITTATTRLVSELLFALPADYLTNSGKYLKPYALPILLNRVFRSFTLSQLLLKPLQVADLPDTCRRLAGVGAGNSVASRVYLVTTGILARPLDQR